MSAQIDYLPLIDNFVNVQPGDAIRLLPFGTLVKNGKRREITPALAARFRLPHFEPPIKLGSHKDETPAGGHITGLEVRADGLYGLTTNTDKGAQAIAEGDYRYNSPEIIWEDGALENPTDGSLLAGPLIVGTALTHTPHLGQAAALYETVPQTTEGANIMSDASEMVSVPRSWIERLFGRTDPDPAPDPIKPPAPTEPDKLTAIQAERDDFKAKYEALEADKVKAEQLDAIRAEFTTEEFGTAYIELGKVEQSAEMLSRMDDEMRAWCMQTFKALSAQIDESALTGAPGSSGNGDPGDPVQAFDAAVKLAVTEKSISYPEAVALVSREQPELLTAYKATK